MSESESDQDFNVSQYDHVEDDLNAYGSPTYTNRAQEAAVCRTHVHEYK